MTELTTDTFSTALTVNKSVVVFTASWCGPCKILKKQLEPLAAEHEDQIFTVDIDTNPSLTKDYGIRSVPMTYLFADGDTVGAVAGLPGARAATQFLSK